MPVPIPFIKTPKKKSQPIKFNQLRFLLLEGFEPPQAEPESDVLPLHHKAIYCLTERLISIKALFPFASAKLPRIFELCNSSRSF